jgi:hypothetical protein
MAATACTQCSMGTASTARGAAVPCGQCAPGGWCCIKTKYS